mmetsp:Transcript_125574/g.222521  ORF Transcript_125574/g.222521 Transcript_125574/m.222521 type:complete len:206 (+) Transcript_125574:576-1193(+)
MPSSPKRTSTVPGVIPSFTTTPRPPFEKATVSPTLMPRLGSPICPSIFTSYFFSLDAFLLSFSSFTDSSSRFFSLISNSAPVLSNFTMTVPACLPMAWTIPLPMSLQGPSASGPSTVETLSPTCKGGASVSEDCVILDGLLESPLATDIILEPLRELPSAPITELLLERLRSASVGPLEPRRDDDSAFSLMDNLWCMKLAREGRL